RPSAPPAGRDAARRRDAGGVACTDRARRPRCRVPRARRGERVSLRVTWATALRVLRQLRRDPRTLALLLVVPPLLITLFRYVFDAQPQTFDRVGGPMVGLFPFTTMFVV